MQMGRLDGVCGSDHVTYRNPCDLRRAACVKRTNVTVISQLPCGECDDFLVITRQFSIVQDTL